MILIAFNKSLLQWIMKKEKEQAERAREALGRRVTAELPPRSSAPAFTSGAQMVAKEKFAQRVAAAETKQDLASKKEIAGSKAHVVCATLDLCFAHCIVSLLLFLTLADLNHDSLDIQ